MGTNLHADKAEKQKTAEVGTAPVSTDTVGPGLSSRPTRTDGAAFSAGTDAFFGRSAFGSAPAVTQSASMGAEQGGLLDWFKGLFGKSGSGTDAAPEPEPAPPDAAPEPVPAVPAQEVAEGAAQPELVRNDDPQQALDHAAQTLRSSKKWGWRSNTELFERVSSAIDASIGQLSAPLSGDMAQDQDTLNNIIATFGNLIQACDDYLSRNPITSRGKHRQEIVRQVRELAVKDRGGFVRYMMTPDEGEHFTSAMDVLTRSRQRTLQLVDKNEAELEHVGGAASYIAKIEPGMLTDANASGFFKEDETYTKYDLTDSVRKKLDALEKARRKMTIPDAQYQAIKTAILQTRDAGNAAGYNADRTTHEAAALVERLASANDTASNNLKTPLQPGESLNLSKRNVATSRLAELLGVGDLVAKSETAELVDANGTSRSGNLMQKAKGQEVLGFIVEHFSDEFAAARKNQTGMAIGVKMQGNLDDKVTPEFLQSLMSLQVLDNLAAQADRHAGNYFAEIKDGKLGKVQGIDNDFSFTSSTLEWESTFNRVGAHGKNILDEDGELMVPYMDKALADRITALDESVLRDVIADILEPWAIDALCVRFNKIKSAIQRDQEKNPNSGRYLERGEDWGRQDVFDTLRNGVMRAERAGMKATNYVSNVLAPSDMSKVFGPGSQDFRGMMDDVLANRLCGEILAETQTMGSAEEVKACLRSYGVTDNIISYLEVTGQLFDGPALLKRLPWNELGNPMYGTILEKWKQEKKQREQGK